MKNPYLNALAAAVYIAIIVVGINLVGEYGRDREETILIPMAMLSLFVLSAAIMSYLFVLEPLRMYLDGKKKEAVDFFVKIIATFAGLTVLFIAAMLVSL